MSKKQEIPQWFIEDPGYRTEICNGKDREYDFKNIFISETDDPNSGEYLVDLRVHRDFEAETMRKAILIKDAPKNAYKVDAIIDFCNENSKHDPSGPSEEWQAGFRVALEKIKEILIP